MTSNIHKSHAKFEDKHSPHPRTHLCTTRIKMSRMTINNTIDFPSLCFLYFHADTPDEAFRNL